MNRTTSLVINPNYAITLAHFIRYDLIPPEVLLTGSPEKYKTVMQTLCMTPVEKQALGDMLKLKVLHEQTYKWHILKL